MLATEAEYVRYAQAAMEVVWIHQFLLDLGLVLITRNPIPLRTDSMTAIYLAKDPQLHQRANYISRNDILSMRK